MKEFANVLWTVLRHGFASVLSAIGCFIGLPGLVLTEVASMFIDASNFVLGVHEDVHEESEDEDTDLVYL